MRCLMLRESNYLPTSDQVESYAAYRNTITPFTPRKSNYKWHKPLGKQRFHL